jgi:hypothetical protein
MTTEASNSQSSTPAIRSELEAMKIVGEALDNLSDPSARARVLAWVASRFGLPNTTEFKQQTMIREAPAQVTGGEIPGIARLSANGELELTVRDVKARSTLDAAIRLAHIVIYATERLKGDAGVSSKKVLVPILKDWRAYDGNTRTALARHKGIQRDGDTLSLDAIAKKEAEKYIAQVLDDSLSGAWNPNAKRSKRAAGNRPAPLGEEARSSHGSL